MGVDQTCPLPPALVANPRNRANTSVDDLQGRCVVHRYLGATTCYTDGKSSFRWSAIDDPVHALSAPPSCAVLCTARLRPASFEDRPCLQRLSRSSCSPLLSCAILMTTLCYHTRLICHDSMHTPCLVFFELLQPGREIYYLHLCRVQSAEARK